MLMKGGTIVLLALCVISVCASNGQEGYVRRLFASRSLSLARRLAHFPTTNKNSLDKYCNSWSASLRCGTYNCPGARIYKHPKDCCGTCSVRKYKKKKYGKKYSRRRAFMTLMETSYPPTNENPVEETSASNGQGGYVRRLFASRSLSLARRLAHFPTTNKNSLDKYCNSWSASLRCGTYNCPGARIYKHPKDCCGTCSVRKYKKKKYGKKYSRRRAFMTKLDE